MSDTWTTTKASRQRTTQQTPATSSSLRWNTRHSTSNNSMVATIKVSRPGIIRVRADTSLSASIRRDWLDSVRDHHIALMFSITAVMELHEY